MLKEDGYGFEPEPFSPFCRRLVYGPRPLGRSWAAFFGYIYIQDRSSMLPPLALAPEAGDRVLDMCASPGSKSGFIAQLVGPGGFVLSNEPSRRRLATLKANLARLNLLQVATCSHPGESLPLPDGSWSHILLDAPCSGWGTAGKHPEVLKLWQGNKLNGLVALQRRLLEGACRLLAPDGRLVYSTCTTNSAENEEQIAYAVSTLGLVPECISDFPGIFRTGDARSPWLQVDGDKSGAQGFFMACLRKPISGNISAEKPDGRALRAKGRNIDKALLRSPSLDPGLLPAGRTVVFGNSVRFLPEKSRLPAEFSWQGALLGRLTGGRVVAEPGLRALCPVPDPNAVVIESLSDLARLVSGQNLATGQPGRDAALWWRDLPLGRVQLRNGHAISRFGRTP